MAEAQAAGVAVLVENVRSDLNDYIGQSGCLFDDVRECQDIIRKPPSEDLRQAGFEQAKKSDVAKNIPRLLDLWRKRNEPAHTKLEVLDAKKKSAESSA